MRRRTVIKTTAGLGAVLLAGCSGGDSDPDDGSTASGTFRLLISDQPVAIDDFDSLDVTLSSARVFRAEEDEEVTTGVVNGTENGDGTPSPEDGTTESGDDETAESGDDETTESGDDETTESGDDETTESGDDETAESGDEESEGFVEFDIDSVTVDLTQVKGDRAISVLEGELDEGRYSGIELRVASAEGVVEDEAVDVKVPSDRLRIVKPFEIGAEEELSFVFDINVVKKGQTGGYNLLPVIGKSGVAGEDVDVEEVDAETPEETGTTTGTDTTDEA